MGTDIIARGMAANASGGTGGCTYMAFPAGWPTTNCTTKQFCNAVNADSTAIQGMAYLGEVRWSDLPANMVNSEVVVEIMYGSGTKGKVIHLIMTSGNRAPYRWEYTYWNNGSDVSGWIGFQNEIKMNPTTSATEDLSKITVGSTTYAIGAHYKHLITLDNKSIEVILPFSESIAENPGLLSFHAIGKTESGLGYIYWNIDELSLCSYDGTELAFSADCLDTVTRI